MVVVLVSVVLSLVVLIFNWGVRDGGDAYRMTLFSSSSSSFSSFVWFSILISVVCSSKDVVSSDDDNGCSGSLFANTDWSEIGLTNRVDGGDGSGG